MKLPQVSIKITKNKMKVLPQDKLLDVITVCYLGNPEQTEPGSSLFPESVL